MNYSPRRTPEQWLVLVDQWQRSGQSAARFCNWRKRLIDDSEAPTDQSVSFIDISALPSPGEGQTWNIVLSLGNGVELRLSQG